MPWASADAPVRYVAFFAPSNSRCAIPIHISHFLTLVSRSCLARIHRFIFPVTLRLAKDTNQWSMTFDSNEEFQKFFGEGDGTFFVSFHVFVSFFRKIVPSSHPIKQPQPVTFDDCVLFCVFDDAFIECIPCPQPAPFRETQPHQNVGVAATRQHGNKALASRRHRRHNKRRNASSSPRARQPSPIKVEEVVASIDDRYVNKNRRSAVCASKRKRNDPIEIAIDTEYSPDSTLLANVYGSGSVGEKRSRGGGGDDDHDGDAVETSPSPRKSLRFSLKNGKKSSPSSSHHRQRRSPTKRQRKMEEERVVPAPAAVAAPTVVGKEDEEEENNNNLELKEVEASDDESGEYQPQGPPPGFVFACNRRNEMGRRRPSQPQAPTKSRFFREHVTQQQNKQQQEEKEEVAEETVAVAVAVATVVVQEEVGEEENNNNIMEVEEVEASDDESGGYEPQCPPLVYLFDCQRRRVSGRRRRDRHYAEIKAGLTPQDRHPKSRFFYEHVSQQQNKQQQEEKEEVVQEDEAVIIPVATATVVVKDEEKGEEQQQQQHEIVMNGDIPAALGYHHQALSIERGRLWGQIHRLSQFHHPMNHEVEEGIVGDDDASATTVIDIKEEPEENVVGPEVVGPEVVGAEGEEEEEQPQHQEWYYIHEADEYADDEDDVAASGLRFGGLTDCDSD